MTHPNQPQVSLRDELQAILDDIDVTVVYKVGKHPEGFVGTKTAADKVLQLFESIAKEVIDATSVHAYKDDEDLAVIEETVGKLKTKQLARLAALLRGKGEL